MAGELVGKTVREIADAVRSGRASPSDAVRQHLEQIDALDPQVGAFVRVRRGAALAEAEAVGARSDLGSLPLAGVPIAIKDNIAVQGEPMRDGSTATPDTPAPKDHEAVRRLREAGAIVVGITRMPELAVWPTSEDANGVARNPWDLERTPGGSSGGSAAAVSAGMVPAAQGNDGMGSIRIPSGCCGLFGLKPGFGVVPSNIGPSSWRAFAENGPLATTVDDAALLLSVMAGETGLAEVSAPGLSLRVAVSTKSPVPGARVDKEIARAVEETGEALRSAGHQVMKANPPYSNLTTNRIIAWWSAVVADEVVGLDVSKLERRNRRHVKVGRRFGRVKQEDRDRWKARAAEFFSAHDVLVTPVMLKPPVEAAGWRDRSWLANFVKTGARWVPFPGAWNFAQYPGASIPAGMHSTGMPIGVQLVAGSGGEALLLQVGRQLEAARPWPRHAPLARVD